jgi:dCMP deaminase
MIIGLTGSMGCGKGEIVKILEKKGFKYVRLSSMVREEAKRRGLPETREMLQDVGNQMRAEGGVGVLAVKALEGISGDTVIDGIRNPGEIEELKKGEGVHIVGVKVRREILVDRILGRGRDGDAAEREEIFMKLDREWGIGEPEDGQQVGKCMEMVDEMIVNEGSLDELEGTFLSYYNGLFPNPKTMSATEALPSKDEYYMGLAASVARRATCLKVQIGAVIIRDDQVVATGYCGAPRGTKSSMEHGFCLRVKLGIPSGHRYEMCRSVHAEQNAIINAARSGTSLLGGDMYIYGERREDGREMKVPDILDAFPCFICKKMLINCGLKRVICSLKDGGMKVFEVAEWAKDWGEKDIIDDEHQYGQETIRIGEKQSTHDEALD